MKLCFDLKLAHFSALFGAFSASSSRVQRTFSNEWMGGEYHGVGHNLVSRRHVAREIETEIEIERERDREIEK